MAGWEEKLAEHQANSNWAPTNLSPEEEKRFRAWLSKTQWFSEIKGDIAKENGLKKSDVADERALDMVLKNSDYDYRGAWKAGVVQSKNPFDDRIHWASSTPDGKILKAPNHPTAWKEFFMQEFGVDPDQAGVHTVEDAKKFSEQKRKPVAERLFPDAAP